MTNTNIGTPAGNVKGAKDKPYEPQSLTMDELDAMVFPLRQKLITPWLPSPGLAMIAGWRGVGKTFTAAGIALSVAGGRKFLGWEVPAAAPVLYVDGEMDPVEMRDERLLLLRRAMSEEEQTLVRSNLFFLTHHRFECGIPDLSNPDDPRGQKLIEDEAESRGAKLIILDNISSLCHTGVENETESWSCMQQWLMGLRRAGYTVLLLHHSGKPDRKTGRTVQRGASKREDVLNTSVMLQRLNGMDSDTFVWEFTKWRGFRPEDEFPVTIGDDGWLFRGTQEERDAKIIEFSRSKKNLSQRDIAARTGCSACGFR